MIDWCAQMSYEGSGGELEVATYSAKSFEALTHNSTQHFRTM